MYSRLESDVQFRDPQLNCMVENLHSVEGIQVKECRLKIVSRSFVKVMSSSTNMLRGVYMKNGQSGDSLAFSGILGIPPV